MLQAHILNLHGNEGAVLNGLVKCFTGIVGVDVHLDNLIVVHQNQTVAQTGQERAKRFWIIVILPGNDKFGEIGEGDILVIKIGEGCLFLHNPGMVPQYTTSSPAADSTPPGNASPSAGIHHWPFPAPVQVVVPARQIFLFSAGLGQTKVVVSRAPPGLCGSQAGTVRRFPRRAHDGL